MPVIFFFFCKRNHDRVTVTNRFVEFKWHSVKFCLKRCRKYESFVEMCSVTVILYICQVPHRLSKVPQNARVFHFEYPWS